MKYVKLLIKIFELGIIAGRKNHIIILKINKKHKGKIPGNELKSFDALIAAQLLGLKHGGLVTLENKAYSGVRKR